MTHKSCKLLQRVWSNPARFILSIIIRVSPAESSPSTNDLLIKDFPRFCCSTLSFSSSRGVGRLTRVSEISRTRELSLPQQIMGTLKSQSGILWLHQLCILILISSTVWAIGKMENMLSAIISFHPKFNRRLTGFWKSNISPRLTNRIQINAPTMSSVKDKELLLSVSLIHASTGH